MRCVFYYAERGDDGCAEGVGSEEGTVGGVGDASARALARANAFEHTNVPPWTQSAENARTTRGYNTNIEHSTTNRALRTA